MYTGEKTKKKQSTLKLTLSKPLRHLYQSRQQLSANRGLKNRFVFCFNNNNNNTSHR